MRRQRNIGHVLDAARLLGDLADEVVFVGGASVALLLTDPAAPDVRPTLDVDVIVEAATRAAYYRVADRLRARGFVEDMDVVCRWRHGALVLDVMPTDAAILGFSNRWYADALRHALPMTVDGVALRVAAPAYFLATKLEAFQGRGNGDYLTSHDMEDMVAVLDGRQDMVAEVAASDAAVRGYLAVAFAALLADDDFLDALPGYLPPDPASQGRVPLLMERMRALATGGA
ncbi:hypothetical protein [Nitratidesulfovibrio sp. 1201_IL3209]|uniref:hypothetical protein n=1 Tax=Nitratidesulfovibrio sp. 1201_IL3209 TaxID=3084053 RepID=UPI002FDB25E7